MTRTNPTGERCSPPQVSTLKTSRLSSRGGSLRGTPIDAQHGMEFIPMLPRSRFAWKQPPFTDVPLPFASSSRGARPPRGRAPESPWVRTSDVVPNRWASVAHVGLHLLFMFTLALLARRNLKLGRGDRRLGLPARRCPLRRGDAALGLWSAPRTGALPAPALFRRSLPRVLFVRIGLAPSISRSNLTLGSSGHGP